MVLIENPPRIGTVIPAPPIDSRYDDGKGRYRVFIADGFRDFILSPGNIIYTPKLLERINPLSEDSLRLRRKAILRRHGMTFRDFEGERLLYSDGQLMTRYRHVSLTRRRSFYPEFFPEDWGISERTLRIANGLKEDLRNEDAPFGKMAIFVDNNVSDSFCAALDLKKVNYLLYE